MGLAQAQKMRLNGQRLTGQSVSKSKVMRGQMLGKRSVATTTIRLRESGKRLSNETTHHDVLGPNRSLTTRIEGHIVSDKTSKNGDRVLKVEYSGAKYAKQVQDLTNLLTERSGSRIPIASSKSTETITLRKDGTAQISATSESTRGRIVVAGRKVSSWVESLANAMVRTTLTGRSKTELIPEAGE